MPIEGFALAVASLNFTGSVLSAIGSGSILLCYFMLPLKRHFRHVLIINLAVSDFINSVNNATSGSQILIHRRDLSPGPGCVLNGLIGQISVQATDCAIFAIAIVTVFTITGTSHSRLISGEWEWSRILCATVAIWFMPFITGFTALGKGWYVPVSGNWCWIVNDPIYLRYVLTHGWRYLFMLLEILLYSYLHIYLRRHFRKLAVPLISNVPSSSQSASTANAARLEPITFSKCPEETPDPRVASSSSKHSPLSSHLTEDEERKTGMEPLSPMTETHDALSFSTHDHNGRKSIVDVEKGETRVDIVDSPPTDVEKTTPKPRTFSLKHIMNRYIPSSSSPQTNSQGPQNQDPRRRAIQRILLLNAYPLLYILLWIPGLAHRLVEASGHKSRVTQIMQSTTQFVGLANAVTYGWNERVWRQLKERWVRSRMARS